nr:MAG: hypothetical protein 3 [Jiangsu sediment cysto-like virus 1]QYF49686.1 MAG: hypothetical protein 4 [Jiangsu sediment cysto-like virus3]
MHAIQIKNLESQAPTLSVAKSLFNSGTELLVGAPSKSFGFSKTYMGSMAGAFLFEVGKGELLPEDHVKVLLQHAIDTGEPFTKVKNDYLDLLYVMGHDQTVFRKVVAGIMGNNTRVLRANAVPTVTPTFVYKLVEDALPRQGAKLITHMITDFICHMLRPLGWVLRDAPYVYRVRRGSLFPRFNDLVSVVEAADVLRTVRQMANADLSLVKQTVDAQKAISPSQVASYMSNALVLAYEASKGKYDPQAVVTSVLSMLGRYWSPNTPSALAVPSRVQTTDVFNSLASNLSLFMAYQDMLVNKKSDPKVSFCDEEMANIVLPEFHKALDDIGLYKSRVLSDCVGFIGKRSQKNHLGEACRIVFHENWDFSSEVSAFTPIAQLADSKGKFLKTEQVVSSALTSCMGPVRGMFNLQSLIDNRLATFELSAQSARMPKGGTEVSFALPSLIEREVLIGYSDTVLSQMIDVTKIKRGDWSEKMVGPSIVPEGARKGSETKALEKLSTAATLDAIDSIQYDYLSYIVHLAVSKCHGLRIAEKEKKTGTPSQPYLLWTIETQLKNPLGRSAITHGRMETYEPLEALTYLDDFVPVESLMHKTLPIGDYEHCVHMWEWYKASIRVDMEATYAINIGGSTYSAQVNEHEMLALGTRRRKVRFLSPTMAVAIARIWYSWTMGEDTFIRSAISDSKGDTEIKASFEGRRIQNATKLVNLLAMIGSTGAGANASRFVRARVADQLYDAGLIDEYSVLHAGVEKHRTDVWAGLTTLRLFGLITEEQVQAVVAYLADTKALAYVVAATDLRAS